MGKPRKNPEKQHPREQQNTRASSAGSTRATKQLAHIHQVLRPDNACLLHLSHHILLAPPKLYTVKMNASHTTAVLHPQGLRHAEATRPAAAQRPTKAPTKSRPKMLHHTDPQIPRPPDPQNHTELQLHDLQQLNGLPRHHHWQSPQEASQTTRTAQTLSHELSSASAAARCISSLKLLSVLLLLLCYGGVAITSIALLL